ncbi:MAG TPA: MBG domain-containing protein, partial [Verrucomicrobiae bacterium]
WQPDGRNVDPDVVLDTSTRSTSLSAFNGQDANGEWRLFLADLESGGTNTLSGWELEITGAVRSSVTWATPADIVYGNTLDSAQLNATASVPGTFVYSPPAGTVPPAGAGQSLSVTFTPTDTTSYVPVTTNVNINVLKKGLIITADDKTKVYGAPVPGLTASYSGFVNGDTPASLDAPVMLNTTALTGSDVAMYAIVASGAADANYTITFVDGTLTVTPAALTITADNKAKVYGADVPAFSASYSGFVNGDTPASLDAPVTLSTSASATSDVGSYPIIPSGAADANYAITFVDGTLIITSAATSGIVSSSANPSLPGQEVTFSFSVSAVAPGAGTPTGTVQFRIDGAAAGPPAPLSAGSAGFSTSSLAVGTHPVVAEYAGDANFLGATNSLDPAQVVNTPPLAGADTIERSPTNGVKVSLAALLSNDSDADGDTLTITVSSNSAAGGTIAVRDDWVFYTPPPGYTNADSFTYTLSDGRGGTATGTVTVAIKEDNVPSPNLTIEDLGHGSFRIRFAGIPGKIYRIQFTEDVGPPVWQTLGTATADGLGGFEFVDTPPPGANARVYRSVYP